MLPCRTGLETKIGNFRIILNVTRIYMTFPSLMICCYELGELQNNKKWTSASVVSTLFCFTPLLTYPYGLNVKLTDMVNVRFTLDNSDNRGFVTSLGSFRIIIFMLPHPQSFSLTLPLGVKIMF